VSGRVPLLANAVLCVIVAPWIGWLDFHQAEVQPAVLLLLLGSGIIAWLQPKYAWLVALMLGLSIVETQFVADVLGRTPAYPTGPRVAALLALIPASIGAAVGALIGVGMTRVSRPRA